MEKRIKLIKWLGTAILLFSFFLPLSRCETTVPYPDAEGHFSEDVPDSLKTYDYFYAWEGIRDGEWAAKILIPVAFLWPLGFLLLRKKVSKPVVNRGLLFLEPVLAVAGAYFVFMINFLNDLYIGFYVAMGGVFLFFLGSVAEIVTFVRERIRK